MGRSSEVIKIVLFGTTTCLFKQLMPSRLAAVSAVVPSAMPASLDSTVC